ncbi:MAG TPA: hypothetical protein VGF55_29700 [Gemmataceae bacterium]
MDETTFVARRDGPRVLLLGGRAWRVTHVDWARRVAHVEATEQAGRSRWRGTGPAVGFPLGQAIRSLLVGEDSSPRWSRRARDRIAKLREAYTWVNADGPTLLSRPPSGAEWWTFAGTRANATLAAELARRCGGRVDHDALCVTVDGGERSAAVEAVVRGLTPERADTISPAVDEEALHGLKFASCLPPDLAVTSLAARLGDTPAVKALLAQPMRVVAGA